MPAQPALLHRNITALFALAALFVGACNTTSGTGQPTATNCTSNPFTCAAGTTCWPTDQSGGAACLPSKSYVARGDDCELLVGDTSCNDGMVCATASTLVMDGSVVQSFCAAYCDTKAGKGCLTGETCTPMMLFSGATAVSVCVPMALPRDEAMDGSSDMQ